jgi:endonuclease G
MRQISRLAVVCGLALALAGPARADDVCEADAGWTPGPANDFETCRTLWEGIGTPVYAGKDVDFTPVCHTRYALSHNNPNKMPDWVIERLTKEQVSGSGKRPKMKFRAEENICPSARAVDKDYAGSKFDRGHQAPSEDFNESVDLMVESFILSNIVPQVGPGFNQHIWAKFEDLVRDLTRERGELYVITGPINRDEDRPLTIAADGNPCRNEIKFEPPKKTAICDANDKNLKATCENGVTVPIGMFKIIYDPRNKRANAYIMPNIDHRPLDKSRDPLAYLKKYRVAVRTVEQYTGLQFLHAIPKRERKAQIEECVATMVH